MYALYGILYLCACVICNSICVWSALCVEYIAHVFAEGASSCTDSNGNDLILTHFMRSIYNEIDYSFYIAPTLLGLTSISICLSLSTKLYLDAYLFVPNWKKKLQKRKEWKEKTFSNWKDSNTLYISRYYFNTKFRHN